MPAVGVVPVSVPCLWADAIGLEELPEEDEEVEELSLEEPDPPELVWLKLEWSELALRHQLANLGGELPAHLKPPSERGAEADAMEGAVGDVAAGAPGTAAEGAVEGAAEGAAGAAEGAAEGAAPKLELATLLWARMAAMGVSFGEVRRVRSVDDRDTQALLWVESVVGVRCVGRPLHAALQSGELLCDLANAIRPGVVPRVTRTAGGGGGAVGMSATRLAAKCRDNITRYLEACTFLDVRAADAFSTADLYDAKDLHAVTKNLLTLGRLAASQAEYHGPILATGKGRVWEQPEDAVANRGEVSELDEAGAAHAWVSAVLGRQLVGDNLQESLGTGVELCELVNTICPGMISKLDLSDKVWGHMENIGKYTRACRHLGVTPVFETPDLFEGKNLKCVAQNLIALARTARSLGYTGPLLGAQTATMSL